MKRLGFSKWKCLYVVQVGLFVAMVMWAICDPQFEPLVKAFGSADGSPTAAYRSAVQYAGLWRPAMFVAAIVIATVSLGGLLTGMLLGSSVGGQARSLRSLLLLTAIVALWCGLAIHHASLAWQGKRLRLAMRVGELETIAQPLRTDWPREDGDLPRIGPFMAYPFGTPTTMILLAPPTVSSGEICISAIQRADDGALKLQLGGERATDWVEWHPESSEPESFVGGLSDSHQLRQMLRLGEGWFLVRYDT